MYPDNVKEVLKTHKMSNLILY